MRCHRPVAARLDNTGSSGSGCLSNSVPSRKSRHAGSGSDVAASSCCPGKRCSTRACYRPCAHLACPGFQVEPEGDLCYALPVFGVIEVLRPAPVCLGRHCRPRPQYYGRYFCDLRQPVVSFDPVHSRVGCEDVYVARNYEV